MKVGGRMEKEGRSGGRRWGKIYWREGFDSFVEKKEETPFSS